MRVGIITAMQEEYDGILNLLNSTGLVLQNYKFDMIEFGYLTHKIYLILSGIGKVNAAMHTQYMIDAVNPECIINVGVAGSLSDKLHFGDLVFASDLVQHDMDVTAFSLPLGQIPRMNTFAFSADKNLLDKLNKITISDYTVHVGRIISGDKFINDSSSANFLSNNFQAIACEMEGAALAHVCHLNNIPFAVIRAISDKVGHGISAAHSYMELKDMVAARSSFMVQQLIQVL